VQRRSRAEVWAASCLRPAEFRLEAVCPDALRARGVPRAARPQRAAETAALRAPVGLGGLPGSARCPASAGYGLAAVLSWVQYRARLPEACRRPAAGRHARDAPRVPAGHLRGALRFAAWPWVVASGELVRRPAGVAAEASPAWLPEVAGAAELPAWPPAEEAAAAVALRAAEEAAAALRAAAEAAVARLVWAAQAGAAAEPEAWLPEVAVVGPRVLPVQAEQPASREAARPSAAVWACRPDRVLPWPAPPLSARSARARRCLQIASL